MWREPQADGGPVAADVHPDEAESWMAAGWRIAENGAQSIEETEEGETMGNKPKPKPRPKQA
ncbi:MAG: hypothetical protein EB117_11400 [Betaproteobacteria bacterium]|nr:hypothetical protein [Betaproteobacteria bacterium]